MNVGERVRLLRQQQRLKGVQLATRAGIDPSYLSKFERGKAGYSHEVITKIVGALGVSIANFYGTANVADVPVMPGIRVPILTYIQAGLPVEVASHLGPDDVLGYTTVDNTAGAAEDIFGVIIRGTSMMPEFSEGDCVIMQRSLAPQPGDCVVAVNGDGEASFKRYRVLKTDEQGRSVFALVPNNPDFPTLRSDELPLTVRATMIEHRKYRRR